MFTDIYKEGILYWCSHKQILHLLVSKSTNADTEANKTSAFNLTEQLQEIVAWYSINLAFVVYVLKNLMSTWRDHSRHHHLHHNTFLEVQHPCGLNTALTEDTASLQPNWT